jgi:hypothetical protein
MAEPRYRYGGDSAIGALLLPERREILQEEQNQFIGYDDRGQAIVQTIPAQYGESEVDFSYSPIVRGAKATGSFLNDIFFGDANEQLEAAGRAVSAVRGVVGGLVDYASDQYQAGMAGGTTYDPETRQITEFDPALVMGGGSSGGGSALASGFRRSGGNRIEQSARMQRAQDLGFDTSRPLYHSTNSSFDSFEVPEDGFLKYGKGVYTTPNAQYSDRYIRQNRDLESAYKEGANVMPLYARGRIGTEEDWEAARQEMLAEGVNPSGYNPMQEEIKRRLQEKGFDGLNMFGNEVIIYDPKNLRSINAEFDPAMSDSDMLLYSGGGRQGTAIAGGSALRESFRIGDEGFDPRFDNRAREQQRILDTELTYEGSPIVRPEVSIFDYEGKPFRITMADRTKAGSRLTGVEGVDYDLPVELQGGQDFMFANPTGREGQVWAQDRGATSAFLNSFMGLDGKPIADEVLMLPYRMAPSGGDFSTMTGEVMVTHARNAVSKKAKRKADKTIKEFYPAWKGIDNPESIDQIREMTGDPRKSLLQVMDRDLRDEGGLGIGQARLAVSDRAQYNAPDFNLQNVGVANPYGDTRFEVSGHRTYGQGLAGRPEGILREQDINVFELMPDLVSARGFDSVDSLLRADPATLAKEQYTLRRGTRGGVITEEMLRDIEARRAN